MLRCLAPRRENLLFDEPFGEKMVALFDPRMERSFKTLLNRIRDLDLVFGAVDLIVLRSSEPDFVADVEGEEGLLELLSGTPVAVLCGSHDKDKPEITLFRPSWAKPPSFAVATKDFREPEMRALLRRSTAVYQQEHIHYQLPSAAVHAEAFIRLADALRDHTDLVRLADWILPMISERSALAADTGSLLGLLATVRNEALRRFGWNVPIATLDEYPRSAAAVDTALDEFEATGFEHLVFLVSVSSTGSVVNHIRRQQQNATIITLIETTRESEVDTNAGKQRADEVFVRWLVRSWPLGDNVECEECPRRQTIYIDPATYTIRADLKWKPEGLDFERIADEASFWTTADRADAVALHVQQPLSAGARAHTRHLAVRLDVARLLADQDFRCLAREALDEGGIPTPDVVIIPAHAATEALAQLATEHFGGLPTYPVPIDRFPDMVHTALHTADRVLVMDDVLITGQTLFGLRTKIYEIARDRGCDIDVWAFVAVCRPPTPEQHIAIRQRWSGRAPEGSGLTVMNRLVAVVEILLPPPGEEHCPWCRERQLLETIYTPLSQESRLVADARLKILRAFPLHPPLTPWGALQHHRTEGSVFKELRPQTAFAAASSLAQHMKSEFRSRRKANTIRVLNLEVLVSAIWEATLFGGVLRTLDVRDARDHTRDSDIKGRLEGKPMNLDMLYELAIAAAEDKLPVEAVSALVNAHESDPHLRDLLHALANCGGRSQD